jgi:hypothetical protein
VRRIMDQGPADADEMRDFLRQAGAAS